MAENSVGFVNLPPVLVPKAPKTTEGDEFFNWARNLTNAVETLRLGLETQAEAYISDKSQVADEVLVVSELEAGIIRAEHISTTGAVITQALQVQDAIITDAKIVSLTGTKITANSITAGQIAASTITATQISTTGAIITQTGQISDAIITSAKIGNLQVGSAQIADLAVTTLKVGNTAITEGKLADLAVTNAKLANLAVTNAKINDLSAAKITTGLLYVNPSSGGATAIFVDNAGSIRMKAVGATRSKISFEDGSAVEKGTLTGDAAGNIVLTASNALQLTAGSGIALSPGGSFTTIGNLSMIRTNAAVGAASGYVTCYDPITATTYKIQLYL